MFKFENKIRVRYADTDQMGYMYYGNYATFYEVARTDMLRSTGISYKDLEKMGVMMPVVNLECNYKKPAFYDELIRIETVIREKPSVKIKFEYSLYNEKDELINTGSTILVFVDMKTGRPCHPPALFMDKIKQYFEN